MIVGCSVAGPVWAVRRAVDLPFLVENARETVPRPRPLRGLVAETTDGAEAGRMSVVVRFEDGPAMGQTRNYSYLDVALPRLTWTGDSDQVLAVYDRSSEHPDKDGVWHYRRVENA
jgi:hypothetical protein